MQTQIAPKLQHLIWPTFYQIVDVRQPQLKKCCFRANSILPSVPIAARAYIATPAFLSRSGA